MDVIVTDSEGQATLNGTWNTTITIVLCNNTNLNETFTTTDITGSAEDGIYTFCGLRVGETYGITVAADTFDTNNDASCDAGSIPILGDNSTDVNVNLTRTSMYQID